MKTSFTSPATSSSPAVITRQCGDSFHSCLIFGLDFLVSVIFLKLETKLKALPCYYAGLKRRLAVFWSSTTGKAVCLSVCLFTHSQQKAGISGTGLRKISPV